MSSSFSVPEKTQLRMAIANALVTGDFEITDKDAIRLLDTRFQDLKISFYFSDFVQYAVLGTINCNGKETVKYLPREGFVYVNRGIENLKELAKHMKNPYEGLGIKAQTEASLKAAAANISAGLVPGNDR